MAKRRNLVNDMKYHYTYRITNIKDKMHYYGVHSCNCLPKEDIGIEYFSSAKKEFINHQKQNPEQYKYKVIKIFDTRVEAVEHEIFLHKKFDVKLHEQFYNRSNQTSTGFDRSGIKQSYKSPAGCRIMNDGTIFKLVKPEEFNTYICNGYAFGGKPKSEECKKKISIANKGYIATEETKAKLREACGGENNSMYGKNHTEESKAKMRKSAEGRIISEETKIKMSISSIGFTHTEESKAKMRMIALNREKVKCPYCDKEGDIGNMKRSPFR